MIVDANTKVPMDITTCTQVSYCDHIQAACSNLVATNADMKKNLETVRSTLLDPVEISTRIVEGKITKVEEKRQALADDLTNGYTLMNKVHDWPGSFELKNHLVYPMREWIQTLFASTNDCIDFAHLQQIND